MFNSKELYMSTHRTKNLGGTRKSRYANILLDEAFKVILCSPENEKLLIKIIELLIPGKKISSLTLRDKEQHGLALTDKNVNFDLYCTSESGEQFIVEMQYSGQASYADLMLCYATYPIRAQLSKKIRAYRRDWVSRVFRRKPRAKMDYSLMPVYVVSLLNFTMPHESDDALEEGLISRYDIRNAGNGEQLTNALHFMFLEIGRFKIGYEEKDKCTTLLEKFVYSLKYSQELKERPEGFREELLVLLYEAMEYANLSIGKQLKYDKIMTTQIDIIARQDYAREEGLKQGIEQGIEQGAEQKTVEIARQMLAKGISAEIVSECTGLSAEEIAAL